RQERQGSVHGCGKLIDRKLMANLRYCHDDKLITDRLYKAAKAQDRTTWLSEQLSSIESTQRLIAAYKLRFPQWKTERADNKRFLTQYVEMVQAETAILYEGDGVMLTEDKFVMHMAKAENGGFSGQKARVEFARLLQDPTTVKDKKHGLDRVRVDLEDHVRFQNKFSKLKQLIQSEAAKKNISEDELQGLNNRVLSGHDRGSTGDDVDMVSMAQRMAANAGKGSSAFEGQLMQMGDLQELVPSSSPSTAAKAKDGNEETAVDDDEDEKDDDFMETPEKEKDKDKAKWMDMERAISRHVRTCDNWIADAQIKAEKAWATLHEVEAARATQDVASKVQHDLDVARGRRTAIGYVLGYDKDSPSDNPTTVESEAAITQLKNFIQELKLRANKGQAALVAAAVAFGQPAGQVAASVASAAGDRAKLGTGPPCKSFEDLLTFAEMRLIRDEFLTCEDKESLLEVQEKFKPIKKAVQELIALCNGVAKDLKGAVTAAAKRVQQSSEQESKRRKVAAGAQPGQSSQAAKVITIFEFLPAHTPDKIQQVPIGRLGSDAGNDNDLSKPFLINIAQDMDGWRPLLDKHRKVVTDFRIEFDASTLRSSVGRTQKAFSKLSADPNLQAEIKAVLFDKIVPVDKTVNHPSFSEDLKTSLEMQCMGCAKNTTSCIPERGHLATVYFGTSGTFKFIALPLVPLLSFTAGLEGKPEITLGEALQVVKYVSEDVLAGMLEGMDVVFHGSCGVNDALFLPPSWVMLQATATEDFLGIKMRYVIQAKDVLESLQKKLLEHKSPSSLVNDVVQQLKEAAVSKNAVPPAGGAPAAAS
ncbi:unnamed protein product, partial [Symbiodinium microadriaticum]